MNLKKYLLFLLFTISIKYVSAQTNFYMGGTSGTGDGMKAILTAAACTPTYDSTLLFYRGGNYGSYGTSSISATACPTFLDSTISFYRGGNYGSYGTSTISATTCPTFLDSTISFYRGGNYGSYSNTNISGSVCVYALDSSVLIYKGGNYGSYSNTMISATTCPYPEPNNIWMGGSSSDNAPGVLNNNLTNNTSGPFISTISDTTIMNGNCITLTTSGVGATSYSWSPSIGLSDPNIANPIANPTTTTTYTVTGTGSSDGCRNTATVVVNVNSNNGVTAISYPSQISTSITTIQNVTLSGITNGVFTSNSANLTLNAANGAITPNTSTVGSYVVTYTYGICNNTVTTPVIITEDASDHGEVVFPNFYMGGTTGDVTPSKLLSQSACTALIDYTQTFYVGGTSGTATPKSILTQGPCTALIDYTQAFYVGGTTGAATPKSILTQGPCTPYVNPSNTIYMGGTTGINTPKIILNNTTCSVPAGTNFYIGGSGTGYGNGSLTTSTSANNGTAVATRSDTTICPGVPVILNTTGATNYTWTPATGLDNTLNQSPTASPITTTTYTVVGSGEGVGCINTAKVTVTVLVDTLTRVSYGGYNFDENDFGLKQVNFIVGPLTGSFSSSPSGLFYDQISGSFTPALSTSGVYAISYNYTKGSCNYSYVSNVNITTLPPSISYPSPSVFYINNAGTTVSPTNAGGIAIGYEALDPFPAGLSMNASTGVITGTASALIENAQVRVRAFNYTRLGATNYSDTYTMTISVRKPIINSTTSSIASMNTIYGDASSEGTLNVSGQYIIENIIITPPTGFEVSTTTGTGFANTISLTQTGGNITSTTIYFRIKSNALVGNLTGSFLLRSQAADDINIPLTTSYVAPAPLTITAKYFQKFYGSKLSLGAGNTNFTSTGLKNGESIGSITLTPSGVGGVSFAVTSPSGGVYVINGISGSPAISLIRGVTYYFNVNASNHPFNIQTSSGNVYTTGVTNAGTDNGTVTFTVPFDAPNILHYVCNTHESMTGILNISDIGAGIAANDTPGLYTITPSAALGGTFSPANYNIDYVPGQFEVLYSLHNFVMTGNTSNWVQGKVPAPKISAGVISNLLYTTATYTSNISNSFSSIVQRGACWNTVINPTINNSKVIDGANTTGLMTSNLTGLTAGTIYYVRTFITVGGYTYYGPNVKFKTATRDGLTAATAGESGVQLHTDYPAYASGWYWIKSASMPNALQMYVDMTEDEGGYDFYLITTGPSVSTVTATNGGTALGLDLVMPRSKNHWKAMSNAVLTAITANKAGGASYNDYFKTAYGVYRTTNAGNNGSGNYTNKVMRHSSYGGSTNASDWRVKDGGKWWLRDNTFGEPNGDYGLNGLLGGSILPNPYNLTNIVFNDLNNNYLTGNYYLVSTNTKQ